MELELLLELLPELELGPPLELGLGPPLVLLLELLRWSPPLESALNVSLTRLPHHSRQNAGTHDAARRRPIELEDEHDRLGHGKHDDVVILNPGA